MIRVYCVTKRSLNLIVLLLFLTTSGAAAYASCGPVAQSGFSNLFTLILWFLGASFAINSVIKLAKFLRQDKTDPRRKKFGRKACIYTVIGILFFSFPFLGLSQTLDSLTKKLSQRCCPYEKYPMSSSYCGCKCVQPPKRAELGRVEKDWERKAQAGDSAARLLLGNFYHEHGETQADNDLAAEWWERAAKAGNEAAQRKLALTANLSPKFDRERIKLLLKFANQNDFKFQMRLAAWYSTKTCSTLGASWCADSDEDVCIPYKRVIAACAEIDTEQNTEEAAFWYKIAASHPDCHPQQTRPSHECSKAEELGNQLYHRLSAQRMLKLLARVKEWKPAPVPKTVPAEGEIHE